MILGHDFERAGDSACVFNTKFGQDLNFLTKLPGEGEGERTGGVVTLITIPSADIENDRTLCAGM